MTPGIEFNPIILNSFIDKFDETTESGILCQESSRSLIWGMMAGRNERWNALYVNQENKPEKERMPEM